MPTPSNFEGINPRETQTLIPCKDAKAQNGVIANTQLIADTVGFSGKNKWVTDLFTDKTVTGVRAVLDTDKSISITGTNTAAGNNVIECGTILLKAGKYKLSGANGGSNSTASLQVWTQARQWHDLGNGADIELSQDETVKLRVYFYQGASNLNLKFYPMLRPADILDSTYEPYRNTTAFPRDEQAVLGAKNIAENKKGTITDNGVTWTLNSDGSVTANGTASPNASIYYMNLSIPAKIGEQYIVSDGLAEHNGDRFARIGNSSDAYICDTQNGEVAFTAPTATISIRLVVETGKSVSNLTFYPMIRLATDPDDTYAPHAMTNRELTEKKMSYDDYKGITIPANADLDDYIKTGFYSPASASDAATITNRPTEASQRFSLEVKNLGAAFGQQNNPTYVNNVVIQKIDFVMNGTPCLYMRYHSHSAANWTAWYKFTGTEVTSYTGS